MKPLLNVERKWLDRTMTGNDVTEQCARFVTFLRRQQVFDVSDVDATDVCRVFETFR